MAGGGDPVITTAGHPLLYQPSSASPSLPSSSLPIFLSPPFSLPASMAERPPPTVFIFFLLRSSRLAYTHGPSDTGFGILCCRAPLLLPQKLFPQRVPSPAPPNWPPAMPCPSHYSQPAPLYGLLVCLVPTLLFRWPEQLPEQPPEPVKCLRMSASPESGSLTHYGLAPQPPLPLTSPQPAFSSQSPPLSGEPLPSGAPPLPIARGLLPPLEPFGKSHIISFSVGCFVVLLSVVLSLELEMNISDIQLISVRDPLWCGIFCFIFCFRQIISTRLNLIIFAWFIEFSQRSISFLERGLSLHGLYTRLVKGRFDLNYCRLLEPCVFPALCRYFQHLNVDFVFDLDPVFDFDEC